MLSLEMLLALHGMLWQVFMHRPRNVLVDLHPLLCTQIQQCPAYRVPQ